MPTDGIWCADLVREIKTVYWGINSLNGTVVMGGAVFVFIAIYFEVLNALGEEGRETSMEVTYSSMCR